MIIIDKPYVSDFIIRTLKKYNFQIISTLEARNMISDESLNWISEEEAKSILERTPNSPLYTNSENSISWIEENLASSNLPGQIQIFKNKIKLRELLKDSFPDYFFRGVKSEELRKLNIEELKFPFIIKPAIGFFSIAVHRVDKASDWNQVLDKIEHEIEELQDLYPKEVINMSDFIIEEYIEGEEYAIDCYFNKDGNPVVLNILHHIFSSGDDVSDRVYSTSTGLIKKHINDVREFLKPIGVKANLKNFPAHIEIRIDKNRRIIPIEVNPLRFGGLCTTGDLSWYAYGINSYECFIDGKEPDWNEISETRKEKKYSIIVLDNNSGIKENVIESFDYDQLLKDFEKPMSLRKLDFNKYLVFGILFVETTCGNDKELNQILNSNLRKYIKIKQTAISTN